MLQRDLLLASGQGAISAAVLGLALFSPRVGEPAMLIPLAAQSHEDAFAFAESENARLVTIDPSSGRLIVLHNTSGSLIRALAQGFLPVDAGPTGCAPDTNGTVA